MNVNFTGGSGQTEAGRRFRHAYFLPDFGFHGDWKTTDFTQTLSRGVVVSTALVFCLSARVVPFPFQPQFDCCTFTQPTLQRAAQASSTLPLEGALQSKLQGKVVLILLRI